MKRFTRTRFCYYSTSTMFGYFDLYSYLLLLIAFISVWYFRRVSLQYVRKRIVDVIEYFRYRKIIGKQLGFFSLATSFVAVGSHYFLPARRSCRSEEWRQCKYVYIVSGKIVYGILGITSSNIDRFSKFFHCYNLLEICNNAVIKYLTTPHTRRYTTLWKTNVRKLLN